MTFKVSENMNSSDENAIVISGVSKVYKLYQQPFDRVKETFGQGKKKYYQEFFALDGVSFAVRKGETVGFVGRNGSGKSTLLKILTGVLQPTEGSVQVNGKVSALLELGAGFNSEFTGRENIYLNGKIMRIPRGEMEKRLPAILEFADIGNFIDQPVKTYSSGMFVRLAFAVAINVDPEILIVDEALAVGDTRFQLKCMDTFKEFQRKGKTILFVSHDIPAIKRFCERTIWLNQGKMIMEGDTDFVTDQYTDFLKSEISIEEFLRGITEHSATSKLQIAEEKIDSVELAEIISLEMLDENGRPVNEIQHGTPLKLVIQYIVNDTTIENPVLGVAIRSMDDEYICGLNTLLDSKKLSWNRGINSAELIYENFNLVGGNYYFDAAIMDSTATVNIDYKTKIRSFFVSMNYIAEGIVVLDHKWKT